MVKKKLENKKNIITTIKIKKITKDRLDNFKERESETYDLLINKTLNIINICRKNPIFAARILKSMERSKKIDKIIENPDKILKRKNSYLESKQERIPGYTNQN